MYPCKVCGDESLFLTTARLCELTHDIGFEFGGTWITDPTVSECSRFQVDPVEYYGQAYIDFRDLQAKVAKIDKTIELVERA